MDSVQLEVFSVVPSTPCLALFLLAGGHLQALLLLTWQPAPGLCSVCTGWSVTLDSVFLHSDIIFIHSKLCF